MLPLTIHPCRIVVVRPIVANKTSIILLYYYNSKPWSRGGLVNGPPYHSLHHQTKEKYNHYTTHLTLLPLNPSR